MAVGNVITPIQQDWVKPADWIDISSVANNEINMLVSDGSMAFNVTTSSGTYSIDWGDGVIETGRVGGTTYQHTYVLGSGTPTSYGYTQYRIRIYGASGNITRFLVANPTITNSTQSRGLPLLWLVMGTNNLTTLQFLAGTTNNTYCSALQSVTLPPVLTGITNMSLAFIHATSLQQVIGLDSPWGNVTTVQQMFDGCIGLRRANLPAILPNTITSFNGMFNGCQSLEQVNLPTSWPTSTTDLSSMFNACVSLKYLTIPSTWPPSLNSLASMFANCNSLESITLPASGFPNGVTTAAQMFNGCFSLISLDVGASWGTGLTTANLFLGGCRVLQKVTFPTGSNNITNVNGLFQGLAPNTAVVQQINNLDKLGSTTAQVDMGSLVSSNLYITGSLNINAAVSRIAWVGGGASSKTVLTGLRLLNTGSNFVAPAPQVNVSFTNMETGSLQSLFIDLKNATTGSITITGANGATPIITQTTNFFSGSNVATISNTTGLAVGMEMQTAISGVNIAIVSVAGNTFSTRNVGVSDGDAVFFTNNGPANNVATRTLYYVVNAATDSFQISTTLGGPPLTITGTGGTGAFMLVYPTITNIVPNTSITISRIPYSTVTQSTSYSLLKRSYALGKLWTVTG